MSGRRILVTGAASGIGAAAAARLAADGAEVVGLDRWPGEADAVASWIACDLGDPAAIARAADEVLAGGELHGLVNAAGVPGSLPAETVFRVNLVGLRELTERLLPRLAPGGAVVHVASTAGSAWHRRLDEHLALIAEDGFDALLAALLARGLDGPAAYDFAKETLVVLTMRQARERFRADGVRVNAVSPGPVETPILPDFLDTMGGELLGAMREACGRNGAPADLAAAVAWLLSDEARWVNGANLIVDGGADAAWLTGGLPVDLTMW